MSEMMDGSQSKASYLKVGARDGFTVGIKPVVEKHEHRVFVGVRIRIVPALPAGSPDVYRKAFPEITFNQWGPERGSFYVGELLDLESSGEAVAMMTTKVIEKVASALTEKVKIEVNLAAMSAYLEEEFAKFASTPKEFTLH